MAKVTVYNLEGKKVEELALSDSVFAVSASDVLVHQVFVSLMANKRQVLADTKTRGERAGSGIKPWRQKGTGRARVGSVRTPVWRKGGVIFGPTSDRNFKKKINRKMNIKAILAVLSGKLKDGELIVVDTLKLKEAKTKTVATAFKNLKLSGKTLIGLASSEKETLKAARNIQKVTIVPENQLNVMDMLNHKNLVLSKESITKIEERYKQ